ncbi:MAG: hypothetical protein A2140_00330 [Candidatus Muproteobacteria bacterium RBG_16_62_13]|uniref:Type 4 fimbrial biogenesis protein PilX N-terminal domain-containing protein n=1 Tax=Candidatus Muproteobacteria bacterium RBG_16_62_13 TaxID=1817756 RepID=A0A1F6T726_9PROT|nr:MAG: hypothetical protein A2140_00330 [Candidatus Muproteobacteria bacterium RBG_16_62_13]
MPTRNRGFALIAAIILIVVAAAMAVVMATLVSSSSQSGAKHISSAQALFIAEAGLEKAIRQRSLDNTYVGEGPTAMGQGSYTITVFNTDFSGVALPSGQRRLRSVGQFDTATRTVEAIVRTGAAMMVYAKDTPTAPPASDVRGIPFFRQWNNDTYAWGPEQQANDVGLNIRYIVLKFARTRNEAILGTVNSSGQIHVQVWNGTAWGAIRLLSTVAVANSQYRGFDIEYETQGDRAVVVFNNADNRNPAYQIWDGTAWTATVGLNSAANLNGNYNTTGNFVPRWIELAPNPLGNSNEIVLMTLDSSSDVYGVRWNGTAWVRMAAATTSWDTAASTNARKAMDVAYEQQTGRAMFIWGNNVNDQQLWRTWDGGTNTLSGISTLTIGDMNSRANWIRLVPRPNSNQMMYVVQDNGLDLNTALWDGAAFTVHPEHDPSTENAVSMNFDFVFETHPARAGRGWLVWGDGSNQISAREWAGAGWNATNSLAGTDDTSYVRLVARPGSGVVFGGTYERQGQGGPDDIFEVHQTGGSGTWTAPVAVWNGPTIADPVHQRVDIAAERYKPILAWREVFP